MHANSSEASAPHTKSMLSCHQQEDLCTYDKAKEEAAASLYSMPTHMFYKLHPFHLLMAEDMTLLQVIINSLCCPCMGDAAVVRG